MFNNNLLKNSSFTTLLILLVFSGFSGFSALAKDNSYKTQGHYFGLDLTRTRIKFHERYAKTIGGPYSHNSSNHRDTDTGFGLKYKYAINFNNLFIAPGIFSEINNSEAKGEVGTGDDIHSQIRIKNRTGVKLDIGYDINRFSPFITGGYSLISYKTKNWFRTTQITQTFSRNGTANDFFYGAGLNYKVNKDITLDFEYNRNSFYAKTSTPNLIADNTRFWDGKYKTTLNIYKLGVSYKF